MFVVTAAVFTDDISVFSDFNRATVVSSCRCIRLLLALAGLISRNLSEDRGSRILNLDSLNVLGGIACAIVNRPHACYRVCLWAYAVCNRLGVNNIDRVIAVVRGCEHFWSGDHIAFNRFICGQRFCEGRCFRVSYHNGKLVIRAVAALVRGRQGHEVLVVPTSVFTYYLTDFCDSNRAAVVSSCRRV